MSNSSPLLILGEVGAIPIATGEVQPRHTRDAHSCTQALAVDLSEVSLTATLLVRDRKRLTLVIERRGGSKFQVSLPLFLLCHPERSEGSRRTLPRPASATRISPRAIMEIPAPEFAPHSR